MDWFLQVAIEQALTILNWYENLPKKEVPPEHLWEDAEGLDLWWKIVEAKRGDETASGYSDAEESDMTDNDMAREFRKMAEE